MYGGGREDVENRVKLLVKAELLFRAREPVVFREQTVLSQEVQLENKKALGRAPMLSPEAGKYFLPLYHISVTTS